MKYSVFSFLILFIDFFKKLGIMYIDSDLQER